MKQPLLILLVAFLARLTHAQTFAPVVVISCGQNGAPQGLAVADVNADGKPDVLTANGSTNSAGVLLGTGTGAFMLAPAAGTNANSYPRSIAVADINSDGKADVLLDNSNGYAVSALLGNGTGSFTFRYSYPLGVSAAPGAIVAADVNGDGQVDILTTNTNASELGVLLGNGAAGFAPAAYPSTGTNSYPGGLAVGDVNKDGKPDAVTANAGTIGVLLGNGSGAFALRPLVALGTGSFPTAVAIRDVSGDGNPDVLVADYLLGQISVLLGNGLGAFTVSSSVACGGQPKGLAVADINQDGKLDIVTANSSTSTVGILLGNGAGGFALSGSFSCGANSQPAGLAVADVNNDGRPDILTANYYTSTVGVLLNATPLAARMPLLTQARATVSPNPMTGVALLTVADLPATASQLEATLTDAAGRTVQHLTLPLTQGAARAALATGALSGGLYLLRLTGRDAGGNVVGTLPVQRVSVR